MSSGLAAPTLPLYFALQATRPPQAVTMMAHHRWDACEPACRGRGVKA